MAGPVKAASAARPVAFHVSLMRIDEERYLHHNPMAYSDLGVLRVLAVIERTMNISAARRCIRPALFVALLAVAASAGAKPITMDIVRDRFGVPHVFADTSRKDRLAAVAYAVGYAQAQDRLFELDIFRRAARGRLAELAVTGAPYLSMDIDARRDGSTAEQLARNFRQLSPTERRALRAFAAGINRRIAEVSADPSQLPFEFAGQPPVPWDVTDTLAVGELELSRFGVGAGAELENARLLAELRSRFGDSAGRGVFDDLLWIEDPSAPVTIAPEDETFDEIEPIRRFAPAQMAILDRFAPVFARAATRLDEEKVQVAALARRLAFPRRPDTRAMPSWSPDR